MVDGTSGCCASRADLRATSRRTMRLCAVGAPPTQGCLLESRASLEADMTQESSDRSKRQRVHMQVTGRGEHGYPVNQTPGGPYSVHTTGTLGSLSLRQHESGETSAFLHPGRERGGGMGVMGSATTAAGSTTRSSSYTEMAVARQCEREGCNVQPSYGIAWKKPRFCARHKLPGMMDVRNRRCEHPGCTRQPSYGQEGQRRQFCFTHKREGDVDVKSTRCKSAGCPKHAMYGRPGEMPQYCSAHKAEDMVDVKKRRRCNAEGCDRRASYALEGEKAAFCSAHKQPGHVNVNNRRCEYHGCSRRPVFSVLGEKPRFCGAHKLEGMSDSRQTAESRARTRAAPARQSPQLQPGAFGGQVPGTYSTANRVGSTDTMFTSDMAHVGEVTPRTAVANRHAAAQATVSAAAAVIAALEDEARADYREGHYVSAGHHADRLSRNGSGGGNGNGGLIGNGATLDGHDDMHGSSGTSYRDIDDSLYAPLQQNGAGAGVGSSGSGMSRGKPEVGGWTSALFAADREGPWSTRAQIAASATMAPSHGQGAMWAQPRSAPMPSAATAAAAALVESSPETSGRGSSPLLPDYHRMPAVTPIGSSHYMDERSSRGILNSLGGSGSGSGNGSGNGGNNGNEFFSSFTSSSSQPFTSALREHGHMIGTGSDGGNGNGDISWERPRPRPPPLPAPLPSPSSWSSRGMGTSSTNELHRLAGLVPSGPQRLPSLLSRRAPLPPPSLAYDGVSPRGVGAGGDMRGTVDSDGRSRRQG